MREIQIHQQIHGYKNGHQLLSSSVRLGRENQDLIDRLSDISGALRPGENFNPYITGYPLPSGEYYVIAKTWQDFSAPRAGCVLTRSLLVPISIWANAVDVAGIIDLIRPIELDGATVDPLILPLLPRRNVDRHVPDGFNAAELVEALFLEKRQSVVLFECGAAESVLVSLLNSFWPAFRSRMAFCEMALAPRRLHGQEFDLLFAPGHVRARFSEWKGRRIEADRGGQEGRHRWTQLLRDRIFSSNARSLSEFDEIGVLTSDAYGDESLLRLSIMWGELVVRAESSPMAVLGLLDILNSLSNKNARSYAKVYKIAVLSIDGALRQMEPLELMQYLNALLIKSLRIPHRYRLLKKVVNELGFVVSRYSDLAMEFLAGNDGLQKVTHPVIYLAVARGLVGCDKYSLSLRLLDGLKPETALTVILSSRLLCRQLIADTKMADQGENASYLYSLVREAPDELRSRARVKCIRFIRGRGFGDFLCSLLVGADSCEVLSAVRVIWENTKFEFYEYDEVLVESSRSSNDLLGLRREIAQLSSSRRADRFLGATLSLGRPDIAWLCDSKAVSAGRACRVLAMKLGATSDSDMAAAINDPDLCEQMVRVLAEDLMESGTQLRRLLVRGRLESSVVVSVGEKLLSMGSDREDSEFDRFILSAALRESGGLEDDLVISVFSTVSPRISAQQLVLMSFPPNVGVTSLSRNLILLDQSSDSVRRGILMRIDDVSDRVAYRRVESLDSGALTAWASLIHDAYEINPNAQMRAAKVALEYAYKRKASFTHSLIVSAFPVVYRRMGEEGWRSSLSSIIQLVELDERSEAVGELVEAFMGSKWPPSELLHAAYAAGAVERVVRRLKHVRGGRRYLDEIRRDLKRTQGELSERLWRAMSDVS